MQGILPKKYSSVLRNCLNFYNCVMYNFATAVYFATSVWTVMKQSNIRAWNNTYMRKSRDATGLREAPSIFSVAPIFPQLWVARLLVIANRFRFAKHLNIITTAIVLLHTYILHMPYKYAIHGYHIHNKYNGFIDKLALD